MQKKRVGDTDRGASNIHDATPATHTPATPEGKANTTGYLLSKPPAAAAGTAWIQGYSDYNEWLYVACPELFNCDSKPRVITSTGEIITVHAHKTVESSSSSSEAAAPAAAAVAHQNTALCSAITFELQKI